MKLHDESVHNSYPSPDIIRITKGRDVNCWEVWHNVTLDVHTELLETLNYNGQSTSHLGPICSLQSYRCNDVPNAVTFD